MRSHHGLNRRYYFQEMSPDARELIWAELRLRMGIISSGGKRKPDYAEDALEFGVDAVVDEATDDFINRHNNRRTVQEWLSFAEKGKKGEKP